MQDLQETLIFVANFADYYIEIMICQTFITPEQMKSVKSFITNDVDDNGKEYTKTIQFVPDSYSITDSGFCALRRCNSCGQTIFHILLERLRWNTNVIEITRNQIATAYGLTECYVSRGFSELIKNGLLIVQSKNVYAVPIDMARKGNVDKILERNKQEMLEKETIEKSITEKPSAIVMASMPRRKKKTN